MRSSRTRSAMATSAHCASNCIGLRLSFESADFQYSKVMSYEKGNTLIRNRLFMVISVEVHRFVFECVVCGVSVQHFEHEGEVQSGHEIYVLCFGLDVSGAGGFADLKAVGFCSGSWKGNLYWRCAHGIFVFGSFVIWPSRICDGRVIFYE